MTVKDDRIPLKGFKYGNDVAILIFLIAFGFFPMFLF